MNKKLTPDTDAAIYPMTEVDIVWPEFARKLERERDAAREQVKELIYIADRAIALAAIDFENDKFGVVSELRDDLEKIQEAAK